jgi:cyclophilin family peptidyl-prolyl cis-trans isomerase
MTDSDPRVRAAALGAWANAGPTHRETAAEAARSALRDSDPLVRRAAISALAPANNPGDIDLMAAAWGQADVDSREAIIIALGTLAREQPELIATLASPTRRVLLDRPADASLRALAARVFPALGARWAPIYPVETGRTMEDYRGIVRTFVLAQDNPRLIIDVEGRGNITIELFPREAPLTVANFLQLVGRGYFDGNRWHRVVPNFVVQDGDRTGLGNSGPGWAIRDEINRRQYDIPMLGMALSGPNTGGSQWFINLSPQPHLNGQYTIFGRVTGTYGPLKRVLQGDLIRTIRLAGQG